MSSILHDNNHLLGSMVGNDVGVHEHLGDKLGECGGFDLAGVVKSLRVNVVVTGGYV